MHFTYKNSLLILAAILLVGGAFALAEYRNSQTKKIVYTAPIVTTSTKALSSELQNVDSDGDGLKDWEEVLLGTDPHKADTDGDGTPDGAEAAAGRNPLVKGPNDKASSTTKNGIAPSATLTATDKAARDFFARYMELNQAGLSGDASSQQQLIEDVIKNGVVLAKPKAYTLKDILVNPDSSKEAIRKYGNNMGAIFTKYQNNGRDEAVIAKEALDKEEPQILTEIDPIISVYKNIISALLKTRVPQNMTDMHLNFINATSKFLFVAESLRHADTDSLRALQGASLELEAGESLFNAFKDLTSYFKSVDISFDLNEAGSMFTPK